MIAVLEFRLDSLHSCSVATSIRGKLARYAICCSLATTSASLSSCAQAIRGDANQVYIDQSFALTDTQGIDQATNYCSRYGKTAVYRGPYSDNTKIFACVGASGSPLQVVAPVADAQTINALHQAADSGDSFAMFKLGGIYSGLQKSNLPLDFTKAMLWYHRAADKGDTYAMVLIGTAYLKGRIGVSADPAEGLRWLTKAANLGNSTSMFAIGMVYKDGIGVPADGGGATRWFRQAASLGNKDAIAQLSANDALTTDPLVRTAARRPDEIAGGPLISLGGESAARVPGARAIGQGGDQSIDPGGGLSIGLGGGQAIAPAGGLSIAPGGGQSIGPGGGLSIAPGGGQSIAPGGGLSIGP